MFSCHGCSLRGGAEVRHGLRCPRIGVNDPHSQRWVRVPAPALPSELQAMNASLSVAVTMPGLILVDVLLSGCAQWASARCTARRITELGRSFSAAQCSCPFSSLSVSQPFPFAFGHGSRIIDRRSQLRLYVGIGLGAGVGWQGSLWQSEPFFFGIRSQGVVSDTEYSASLSWHTRLIKMDLIT